MDWQIEAFKCELLAIAARKPLSLFWGFGLPGPGRIGHGWGARRTGLVVQAALVHARRPLSLVPGEKVGPKTNQVLP